MDVTVGRRTVRRTVLRLLGNGRSVLVTGDPGVGRTHLLHLLLGDLRATGNGVVLLRGTTAGRHAPGSGVASLAMADDLLGGRTGVGAVQRVLHDAVSAPGVVAVDDVHLLDDVTLAAVHGLAHGGLPVVATAAATATSEPRIAELWRDDLLRRVHIGPLDRPDADRMLDALLGAPGSVPLRAWAWRSAAGNPRILREWIHAAFETEVLEEATGYWEMVGPVRPSARLHDLVDQRLATLDRPHRRLLDTLAVTEPIEVEVLAAIAPPGALADLEAHGLVRVDPDGAAATARTSHPLLGDVLRDQIGPLARRAVLQDVLDVLDATPSTDPERCAAWMLEVGRTPTPQGALLGAQLALSRFDLSRAEALARCSPGPDTATLLVLGRAVAGQGRVAEAIDVLENARTNTTDERARLEVDAALVEVTAMAGGDRAEARVRLQVALDLSQDPALRQELMARTLLLAGMEGRFLDALELGPWLTEDALPAPMVGHGLVAHTLAQAMTGQVDGMLDRLDQAQRTADELARDHPVLRQQAGLTRVVGLHTLARFDESAEVTDHVLATSTEEHWLAPWLFVDTPGHVHRGDLDLAAVRTQQAVDLHRRGDLLGTLGQALVSHALVAAMRGVPEAEQRIRTARSAPHGDEGRATTWLAVAEAWQQAHRRDPSGAVDAAREGGRLGMASEHHVWAASALHAAVRIGHPAAVLGDMEGLSDVEAPLVRLYLAHAHAAGAEDPFALAEVARRWEHAGAVAVAVDAWAACARAPTATSAARARAAVRAEVLLRQCAGYDCLLLRDVRPPLSGRQLDVAVRAASGSSSRHIGASLGISAKTVDNHLHAVYRSLDLAGRDGLADVLPTEVSEPPATELHVRTRASSDLAAPRG